MMIGGRSSCFGLEHRFMDIATGMLLFGPFIFFMLSVLPAHLGWLFALCHL